MILVTRLRTAWHESGIMENSISIFLLLTNNFLLPYVMIWIGNNFHGGNAWRDHRRLESKSFYKSSGNILDSSRMHHIVHNSIRVLNNNQ